MNRVALFPAALAFLGCSEQPAAAPAPAAGAVPAAMTAAPAIAAGTVPHEAPARQLTRPRPTRVRAAPAVPVPMLSLLVNGQGDDAQVVAGWPIVVRVDVSSSDGRPVTIAGAGHWSDNLRFETSAGHTWPLVAAAPAAASPPVTLGAGESVVHFWTIEPETSALLPRGEATLRAVLECTTTGAGAWSGVASQETRLRVVDEPAPVPAAWAERKAELEIDVAFVRGGPTEALERAEAAVSAEPSSWRLRAIRSNLLAKAGRAAEAEAALADATASWWQANPKGCEPPWELVAAHEAPQSPRSPPVDRGSGYEFVVPQGWTRKEQEGTTLLAPPGAKDDVRLILYPQDPVANGTYSNDAHFHVAMLQTLTENGQRRGDATTGKTGAFQWSRQDLMQQGAEYRVAAYTAKLRANWCLVAFAGPLRDFDAHVATVERFVKELKLESEGRPVAAGAQEVHGLVMPLPEGWSRKDHDGGAVELQYPAPKTDKDPDWTYMILVLPTQKLAGTFWDTHRAVFDEVVKGAGLANTIASLHEPDAPGPFIRSSTAGNDARGSVRALRMYSALSADGIECVAVFGGEDFATTGAMLMGSKVKKPPKAAPRPKIVEAYRRLSQQTHVEYAQGQQLVVPVPYDRIVLLADGTADFSPIHREGYAAAASTTKLDPSIRNGRCGSWEKVGDHEVHVVRKSDQPAEVYVRDGKNLRLGDKVYEPMPSVDGLVLDGRWVLPGARAKQIEFTAAGRFKDDGLLADVGYLPVPRWSGSKEVLYPRPPTRGEGTYEVREFTLLLQYDDGTRWSADFSTFGPDPKDLSKLLLKSGELHRER